MLATLSKTSGAARQRRKKEKEALAGAKKQPGALSTTSGAARRRRQRQREAVAATVAKSKQGTASSSSFPATGGSTPGAEASGSGTQASPKGSEAEEEEWSDEASDDPAKKEGEKEKRGRYTVGKDKAKKGKCRLVSRASLDSLLMMNQLWLFLPLLLMNRSALLPGSSYLPAWPNTLPRLPAHLGLTITRVKRKVSDLICESYHFSVFVLIFASARLSKTYDTSTIAAATATRKAPAAESSTSGSSSLAQASVKILAAVNGAGEVEAIPPNTRKPRNRPPRAVRLGFIPYVAPDQVRQFNGPPASTEIHSGPTYGLTSPGISAGLEMSPTSPEIRAGPMAMPVELIPVTVNEHHVGEPMPEGRTDGQEATDEPANVEEDLIDLNNCSCGFPGNGALLCVC